MVQRWRVALIGIPIGLVFAAVGARLVHIQYVCSGKYKAEVAANMEGLRVLTARRGNITDCNGALLASTQATYVVGADPLVFDPRHPKVPELAALLGMTPAELERKVMDRVVFTEKDGVRKASRRWRKIAEGLDEIKYGNVRALGVIKGVRADKSFVRVYPHDKLACHVVGFVNKAGDPSFGIESYMQGMLRGYDGWEEIATDSRRREIHSQRAREVQPQDGFNVALTLDSVVQNFVEEEISRLVGEYRPISVSILVSDVRTGAVLGMGNFPDFNLNEFSKAPLEFQRNRAVTDIYEPGSTFKTVTVAAAIDKGIVRPSQAFDCALGSVQCNGKKLDLPADAHRYGNLTVTQIIAKSSNKGTSQIGILLGATNLHDYAKAFGFGARPGLGFGGEVPGIVHHPRNWDGKTITRMPIGHAVSVTPLQVHQAMGALANGGRLMKPMVIQRVHDDDGNTLVEFSPVLVRQVVRPETARTLVGMMSLTTQPGGTAKEAAIPGYQTAGKTGTTQKIVDGRYSNTRHVASFSGFFPASDPRFVITVVVDEPHMTTGLGYGGIVASPAFKNIATKLISYYRMEPVDGTAPGNHESLVRSRPR